MRPGGGAAKKLGHPYHTAFALFLDTLRHVAEIVRENFRSMLAQRRCGAVNVAGRRVSRSAGDVIICSCATNSAESALASSNQAAEHGPSARQRVKDRLRTE